MEDSSEYLQWARRELDVYCTLQWPQMRFPPHIESIIKALEEIVLGLL